VVAAEQGQVANTALKRTFAVTSGSGFRLPISRARQDVEAPKRALDGMEPAVTTSSSRSALAKGIINGGDRIVVELVSPPDMPQVIMIRWPQHSPVVARPHAFQVPRVRSRCCSLGRAPS
jgi:hypothetical protein